MRFGAGGIDQVNHRETAVELAGVGMIGVGPEGIDSPKAAHIGHQLDAARGQGMDQLVEAARAVPDGVDANDAESTVNDRKSKVPTGDC